MHISFSTQTQVSSNISNYSSNLNKNEKSKKVEDNNISLSKSKSSNIIKNLMKQKEILTENKQDLMDKKLKNDESSSAINEEIKNIDKQLVEINSQISKIQLEDQRKALGVEDKDKQNQNSKPKSEKIIENHGEVDSSKNMNNILAMSTNLTKAKVLSDVKTSMQGQSRVLQAEIKSDIARGVNPVAKLKRVSELEGNVSKIAEKVGNTFNENTKINDSNNVTNENVDDSQKSVIKSSKNVTEYINETNANSKQKGEKINTTA